MLQCAAMAEVSLGEIVDFTGGAFDGDRGTMIRGVRPLADAGPSDLTFLANPKYAPLLASSEAAAILVPQRQEGASERWIRVDDPYFQLARLLLRWFSTIPAPEGISAEASISASAAIGAGARIAPGVAVGEGSVIGERVTIFAGASIGAGVTIGDETIIYGNVTIYHGSRIGRRCIIHGGVVIGSDGYGFATREGRHHKIPQIGIVRIDDDVEIGANTTIDRAALGETVIGEGTKIDNLVQIGHNVTIGRHCLIVSQVGIAGSTEIGDYCVFGGQAGASGHLKIGARVQVAAQSAVMKDWAGPATIGGSPARPLREHLRQEALTGRLPQLVERVRALEERLAALEGKEKESEGEG